MITFQNFIKRTSSPQLKELYKKYKKGGAKWSRLTPLERVQMIHKLQWINQELISRGDLYI